MRFLPDFLGLFNKMSLLEDVFLQDEAGEAQELERIIEGDEYDERPREDPDSDENSAKEDEAEEDKRRVDPSSTKTKRVVKNPRFVLNPARLTGPRGISVIPEHFKDFKFKGKGHEKEDLDLVLKKLEHWAYRLYPKFKFDDCLKKIETLGKKRPVAVHLTKIRSDQLITDDDTIVQKDSSDEEELAAPLPVEDEFDQLLQQQIELARATPGPGVSTPHIDKRSPFMAPKATSSPSISDEQKERMIRNRKLAEERRLARLKAAENGNTVSTVDLTNGNTVSTVNFAAEKVDLTNVRDETKAKNNRSNVINSSDEEGELTINEAITVDVHNGNTVSTVDLTNDNIDKNNSATEKVDLTNVHDETKAKKNRSNVIDSSDEEGELTINETTTVDVHNGNTVSTVDLTNGNLDKNNLAIYDVDLTNGNHETRTKKNRSNVIDSSDEEGQLTINEAVDADLYNTNENTIDLTEVQRLKSTKSNYVELVTTGEPNKDKNLINIDDHEMDEAATVGASKSTNKKVIDLTEFPMPKRITSNDVELVITGQPNKKTNVIVSDDEDGEINPSITVDGDNQSQKVVDLTEGYSGQKNHHSNEINVDIMGTENQTKEVSDCSDEEDVSVVSEAIVVDIHQRKTNNVEKANNKTVENRIHENSLKTHSKSTEDDENSSNRTDGYNETNKVTVSSEINDTEMNNDDQNKFELERPSNKNVKVDKKSDADNITDADTTKTLDTGKENTDKNASKDDESLDDLMDVDFSDDF